MFALAVASVLAPAGSTTSRLCDGCHQERRKQRAVMAGKRAFQRLSRRSGCPATALKPRRSALKENVGSASLPNSPLVSS
jgi:hypothetical protein